MWGDINLETKNWKKIPARGWGELKKKKFLKIFFKKKTNFFKKNTILVKKYIVFFLK